jgi:hypothetical protein
MRQQLWSGVFLIAMAALPAYGQNTLTTLASFNGTNGLEPVTSSPSARRCYSSGTRRVAGRMVSK